MNKFSEYSPFVARLLLALPLLDFGLYKINNWTMMIAWLQYKGFAFPTVMNVGAIVFELVGGLLLIAGFKTRWASLSLVVYLILVTFLIHNFWAADVNARQAELENFGKGLMIIGGLLFVFAHGAGRISIDGRTAIH